MTPNSSAPRPRRALLLVTLTAGLMVVACSGTDDDAASKSADGSSTSTSTSAPGAVVDHPVDQEPVEVTEMTITIEHAELGPLTFDAIAAGEPEAAADGKLVLLLHGFPESNEAFREFLAPLAQAGYYAVAPNQRGYSPGARPTAVDDYSIFELVGDVNAMATALGAQTFHLVGHDWGGGIAWVSAVLDPDRLESMAVLSTPHPDAMLDGYADPGGDQRDRSGYVDWFTNPDFVSDALVDGRATFEAIFGAGGGIPEAHVRKYSEVLGTPEALTAALNYYRATSFTDHPRIGAVKVPTLFIFGSDDIAFSPVSAEFTEQYVDADYRYEVIPDGTHWLPETKAAEIIPMVLDHLEKHGS